MIGRADIEESKSNVAMNAWLPQASYPCGSIGHGFPVCIRTENQNQVSFYPFVLHEISVLIELTLGHLCYCLTDVPPQPNSPPDVVSRVTCPTSGLKSRTRRPVIVTPAVYPRLVEFLHFDIQSTGQKSHCVNTVSGRRNALF
ncbi:hypothetical protein ACHAXR_012617 [Thalassiosira sp. AJA248-18]